MCEHSAGSRGWDDLREEHGDTYLTICKYTICKQPVGICCGHRELNPVPCDSREGRGGGTREGSSEGRNTGMPMANSC